MSSTSVHLPPVLVQRMDRLADREHLSRNRLIVLACEEFLDRRGGTWPDGFFDPPEMSPEEAMELQSACEEMETAILSARRNRPSSEL